MPDSSIPICDLGGMGFNMQMINLSEALSATSYPGRGIVIGKSPDGKQAIIVYFIMGRSDNSRNRIFEADGDGIRTRAFDESRMTNPSLIIYAPVKVFGNMTIVTNGDQTDTVYNALQAGNSFEDALRTRTFEPDDPNFTPRISGLCEPSRDCYRLSILKSFDGDPNSSLRFFYEYNTPNAGCGHFLHTYMSDGNPLPSFCGEPKPIIIESGDINTLTGMVWNSLNEDNRISLFVRTIEMSTGHAETRIVNKHGE